MDLTSSAISAVRVPVLSVSRMMVALPSSTSAVSPSMSSLSLLRVILLLPISVSQKPSCCESWFASSSRRVSMDSIIFFTFTNGSASNFCARRPRRWLRRRRPSDAKNSRTRRRIPSLPAAAAERSSRKCARAVRTGVTCAMLRYFSAFPVTSGDDRISMALPIASISSVRSFCFSRKDSCFSVHSVVAAASVFSFSALTPEVAASCFLSNAAFSALCCFRTVFSAISFSPFSMESERSCMIISCACLEFISSFWHSPSLLWNSLLSLLSSSTIPPDWNS
mmetsp:Transcript_8653/g.27582  ORF Transcript_8653/g.27582 Transcript_8653/m.27582 type:complete len:280 (+) Transcript_8653:756-1595(+)